MSRKLIIDGDSTNATIDLIKYKTGKHPAKYSEVVVKYQCGDVVLKSTRRMK